MGLKKKIPKNNQTKQRNSKVTNSKRVKNKKDLLKSQNFIQINENIWPLERDVLFRPDRMKYVRRLIEPKGCVFCLAAQGLNNLQNLCVYRSEHSMIVINKFPYNSGHILVLPLAHGGDLLELTDAVYLDLQMTIRKAILALTKIYQPGGFNVGLNHGAVAGAGVPEHLHYHIIPRWSGDLNFFPLIAETKVMIESVEQTYEKLYKYFNE